MIRATRLLLVWVALGGMLPVAMGYGQTPPAGAAGASTPAAPPPATASDATAEPDLLPGLPRPPDQPASLMLPPSPPGCAPPAPGPYFQPDPRLDPPSLPPPGWFTDLEVGLLGPHVKNRLNGMVQLPGSRMPDNVHVPPAELDWTVAPRIALGYRLPSGFGEFVLDYRLLGSEGTTSLPVAGGTDALRSRLDLNEIDLDYASREFSLWPCWDMKWRFGLRLMYLYFDAQANGPAGAVGGGSQVFAARDTDSDWALGPHVGLKLGRRLGDSGLSLVGQIDGALQLGRIRQGFFEEGTGTGGRTLVGESHVSQFQAPVMLNAQVGLGWQPPGWRDVRFFLGYQYEYWWEVGRLSITPHSRGELSDQGLLFQTEFNF